MQGTEYELWVKNIYDLLYRHEGIENIDIRHNVKLIGAGGVAHQIDIYWEFKHAETVYKTAIECKDYKNPVSMDKISAFHSVLEDIGGVVGIFAAKNGFQSGAIKLAKQYGITPVEIRQPNDMDWEGKIRDIHIDINYRYATNLKVRVDVDGKWAKENGITELNMSLTDPDFIVIDDMNNSDTQTLADLTKPLNADTPGKGKIKQHIYTNAFLINKMTGEQYKILKLTFEYDVNVYTDFLDIYGDKVVSAIVKNITEGTTKYIRFDGSVGEESLYPQQN